MFSHYSYSWKQKNGNAVNRMNPEQKCLFRRALLSLLIVLVCVRSAVLDIAMEQHARPRSSSTSTSCDATCINHITRLFVDDGKFVD